MDFPPGLVGEAQIFHQVWWAECGFFHQVWWVRRRFSTRFGGRGADFSTRFGGRGADFPPRLVAKHKFSIHADEGNISVKRGCRPADFARKFQLPVTGKMPVFEI